MASQSIGSFRRRRIGKWSSLSHRGPARLRWAFLVFVPDTTTSASVYTAQTTRLGDGFSSFFSFLGQERDAKKLMRSPSLVCF